MMIRFPTPLIHWRHKVVLQEAKFSLLVIPKVVALANTGTTSGDKVGGVAAFGFQSGWRRHMETFQRDWPLCGEFTGHRWIPLTKASDVKLWCVLWSASEQTVDQTMEMPVIWDAIALNVTSLKWQHVRKMINKKNLFEILSQAYIEFKMVPF